ncbi:MAG: D-2-hydroxyacid dehydrogenase [Candidatus Hodarchaeota archaeon]
MNGSKILVSFDLPGVYMRRIADVSTNIKVQKGQDEKELVELIEDADILLAGTFSREMFLAAKKLKWIQALGAGVERFLLPEIVKSSIIITSASGIHPIPVSEHALGMIFCFCRKLHTFIRNQMEGKWQRKSFISSIREGEGVEELHGKTMGIVGLGMIGIEIAKKAKALGMKVVATKRNPLAQKGHIQTIPLKNLRNLLAESDFVVLSVPLTKETKGMIGEAQLRSMRKTSYLINISRGKVVQEDKLIQALKEGWIAGAGLDVFETEPLPASSELWKMKNVIITPHLAGATPLYLERLTDIFCENLGRFLKKEPLINVVDKNIGY